MAIVVLLAAGTGTRFNHSRPKQLEELGGKPLIEYSLRVFYDHEQVDEINIVTSEDLIGRVTEISRPYTNKVKQIIKGGGTRSESSFAGLVSIKSSSNSKVLIHDGARPFISSQMISECIKALDTYDAVSVAVPSNETTFEVEEGEVRRIPDRNSLMRAQTPQGFRLHRIISGYKQLKNDESFALTDDCGVIAKYFPDTPIGIIHGSERNIKVTFPEDILIAEAMLKEENLS